MHVKGGKAREYCEKRTNRGWEKGGQGKERGEKIEKNCVFVTKGILHDMIYRPYMKGGIKEDSVICAKAHGGAQGRYGTDDN